MNDVDVLRSFAVLNRTFLTYFSASLVDKSLSYSAGVILANVGRRPGTSQDALAVDLVIDKAAVARAIKELKARKLVRAKRSVDDARVNTLFLTSSGETMLRYIDGLNRTWLAAMTADMDVGERDQLFTLVGKMARRAKTLPAELLDDER